MLYCKNAEKYFQWHKNRRHLNKKYLVAAIKTDGVTKLPGVFLRDVLKILFEIPVNTNVKAKL